MIRIHGQIKFVQGGVLYVLADTLAAHDIGGFKVGVGFSLRMCQMCLATKDQISTRVDTGICGSMFIFKCVLYPVFQFRSEDCTPRTPESYNYDCSLLDGPLYRENSITYGIKFCSPLNELNNFHVVDQLPQDIMHILLEGVLPYSYYLCS